MPRTPRKVSIQTSAYFPPPTYDKLVARSKLNRRSVTSEILDAVEKALQEAEVKEQPKEALAQ